MFHEQKPSCRKVDTQFQTELYKAEVGALKRKCDSLYKRLSTVEGKQNAQRNILHNQAEKLHALETRVSNIENKTRREFVLWVIVISAFVFISFGAGATFSAVQWFVNAEVHSQSVPEQESP